MAYLVIDCNYYCAMTACNTRAHERGVSKRVVNRIGHEAPQDTKGPRPPGRISCTALK